MDATKVVEKILSDANVQAEAIKNEANKTAESLNAKINHEIADLKDESTKIAESKAADRRDRVLASARMDSKKAILKAKRDALDDLFNKAASKLQSLDEESYVSLMSKLIKKAVQTGDEEVLVSSSETIIDDKFIKNINRELGAGFKGNLSLSEDKAQISCGFILRRGDVTINVSGKVLVELARGELESKFASELF